MRIRRSAAGWVAATILGAAASGGCDKSNQSATPASFSANPTDAPIASGGPKTPAKKDRGPADKGGDG